MTGDVRCATLLLGEHGEVHGNIHAERVRVAGLVEGSIETGELAVEASARIAGDVVYSRIRVVNGGIIHGKIKHQASEEQNEDKGELRLWSTRSSSTGLTRFISSKVSCPVH